MIGYSIALFFHILGAVGIVGGSTLAHVLHARQMRAHTNEQLGEVLGLSELLGKVMPIFALLILVAGLYMTITRWGFQYAWIDLSVLLLLGIGASAPLAFDPPIKAVRKLVAAGEPVERSHALLGARGYITTANVFTGESIAVVALMTFKPDWLPALIIVVVAAIIGIALVFVGGAPAGAKAGEVETRVARRQ